MYGMECGALLVAAGFVRAVAVASSDRPEQHLGFMCLFPTVMVITFSSFRIQRPLTLHQARGVVVVDFD
uniref:Putative secreted protein n=1 Tax=Anopheles marajoara TaxID=58244 RepID=A0A2M4CEV1_9DIPT